MELVVIRGNDSLVTLPIDSSSIRIGRSATNDLAIPDPTVSRHQCVLTRRDGRLWLTDSSGQGTSVDGKRYTEIEIKPGSRIQFGQLAMEIRKAQKEVAPATTLSGGKTDILCESPDHKHSLVLERHGGKSIPLRRSLSVGADAGNDLRLDDGFISSFHCRLTEREQGWFVQDLDSTNGTFVNEIRVGEAKIEPGMQLRLGREIFRVGCEEPEQTEQGFCGIISQDPAMDGVFNLVRQAAPTDETVLITGETGSGKELIAQAIHKMSLRKNHALVPLNCSAISKELLESELFGHEKGAFTGAQNRRRGLFEEADGGSLFLDEIGELAVALQAKLLRVLENGEIRPVGSDQPKLVDARLICATHRRLPEQVRAGEFREDLYYRICVIEIAIPPLRERPKDIPLLAQFFLTKATRHSPKQRQLSEKALEKMQAYGFPGNVRELKHAVTRAAILCPDPVIGEKYLTFSPPSLADQVAESGLYKKGKTLRDVEIEAIKQALAAHDYTQKAAARSLGIARSTLHQKMERYDISAKPEK